MHAWTQSINAVTGNPLGANVTAAMATREYAGISNLMATTGLDDTVKRAGKLTVAEVDKALASTRRDLPPVERIRLKTTLVHLGLLS